VGKALETPAGRGILTVAHALSGLAGPWDPGGRAGLESKNKDPYQIHHDRLSEAARGLYLLLLFFFFFFFFT
jgi:hypothetical protein